VFTGGVEEVDVKEGEEGDAEGGAGEIKVHPVGCEGHGLDLGDLLEVVPPV
jgi:hypothetical protein